MPEGSNAGANALGLGLVALLLTLGGCCWGPLSTVAFLVALVGLGFGVRSAIDLDDDLRMVAFGGVLVCGLLVGLQLLRWLL